MLVHDVMAQSVVEGATADTGLDLGLVETEDRIEGQSWSVHDYIISSEEKWSLGTSLSQTKPL